MKCLKQASRQRATAPSGHGEEKDGNWLRVVVFYEFQWQEDNSGGGKKGEKKLIL